MARSWRVCSSDSLGGGASLLTFLTIDAGLSYTQDEGFLTTRMAPLGLRYCSRPVVRRAGIPAVSVDGPNHGGGAERVVRRVALPPRGMHARVQRRDCGRLNRVDTAAGPDKRHGAGGRLFRTVRALEAGAWAPVSACSARNT